MIPVGAGTASADPSTCGNAERRDRCRETMELGRGLFPAPRRPSARICVRGRRARGSDLRRHAIAAPRRSVDPYAVQVAGQLWPGHGTPTVVRRPGRVPAGAARDWWVLPSAGHARMLVPVGHPTAARMLTRHGGGRAQRVARALLARGVRTGALAALPVPRLRVATADDTATCSLEAVLGDLLGTPVATGVLLGTPRVNRKPVVQVFDPTGRTVAFVKVGTDDATRRLVRRESANLARLQAAGLTLVQPPEVLLAGPLGDLELLVLSPLASSQQERSSAPPLPLEAMAEVAAVSVPQRLALASTPFWQSVQRAAAGLDGAGGSRMRDLVGRVDVRWGASTVVTGSWHGDWAPWNMGLLDGRVQVWDWERFDVAGLWGLDVVHFAAQRVRHAAPDAASAERSLLQEVPVLVASLAPHGRDQDPTLLVVAYLAALALRLNCGDSDGDAGGPVPATGHPRALWALRLAERLVAEDARG